MAPERGPEEPLRNRAEAGRRLAERLSGLRAEAPIVLALPRGGVVVAREIARTLSTPLDVLIVRKIGAPDNPEYGLGAVAEDGTRWLDEARVRSAGYSAADVAPVIERELAEVRRRAASYREGRPPPELLDRTVVLVDDGVATGGTLHVAIRAVRARSARRVVVALGVAPAEALPSLLRAADDLVVLLAPRQFYAVGDWYRVFDPVDDGEVREILAEARRVPWGAES
jgi:putative phosphoribosyl transferase